MIDNVKENVVEAEGMVEGEAEAGPGVAAEVNISPTISISAQPLKLALHRNPAMHGSRTVIFLHDSNKAPF